MAVLGWKNITSGALPDPTEVSETTGRKLGDLTRNWYKGSETWLEIDKRRREEMTAQEAVKINAARDAAELDRIVAAQAQNPVRGANYDSLSQGITDKRSAFTSDAYTRAQEADIHTDNIRDDEKLEAQKSLWLRQAAQEDAAARAHAGRAAISENTLQETELGYDAQNAVQTKQQQIWNDVLTRYNNENPGLMEQYPDASMEEVRNQFSTAMGHFMSDPVQQNQWALENNVAPRHVQGTEFDVANFDKIMGGGKSSSGRSTSSGTGTSETGPLPGTVDMGSGMTYNFETNKVERTDRPPEAPMNTAPKMNSKYMKFSNSHNGQPINLVNSLDASGTESKKLMNDLLGLHGDLIPDHNMMFALIDGIWKRDKEGNVIVKNGIATVDPKAAANMRSTITKLQNQMAELPARQQADFLNQNLDSLVNFSKDVGEGAHTAEEVKALRAEDAKQSQVNLDTALAEHTKAQDVKDNPLQIFDISTKPPVPPPTDRSFKANTYNPNNMKWNAWTKDRAKEMQKKYRALDPTTKAKVNAHLKEYNFQPSMARISDWAKLVEMKYDEGLQSLTADEVLDVIGSPK